MAKALDLKFGGPGFKSSSLPLDVFVFGGPEFNSSTLCKWPAGLPPIIYFTLFLPESGEEDKLFETDIMLTPHDHDRVDTSPTGHEHGADVDVDSIQGQKRKAIRTRRKLWPSRIVPVEITPAACK